jgi:hypothetical protein
VRARVVLLLERLRRKPASFWIELALVLIAIGFGAFGVGDALVWWVGGALAVIAVVAAFQGADEIFGRLVGAVLAGTLALVGFNVVSDWLADRAGWHHRPILLGLAVAVVVFGLAAFWYLRRADWPRRFAGPAAGVLAGFLVLAVPVIVESKTGKSSGVLRAEAVRSKVDVLIVTDGKVNPAPPAVAADPALRGFDVSYSVGVAHGDGVDWTLDGSPSAAEALRVAALGRGAPPVNRAPVPREGADPVLVLLVDGTAPVVDVPADLPSAAAQTGEVGRWRRIAKNAAPADTPAFALLQTTRRSRLQRWRDFTDNGGTISIEAFGTPAVTDAGAKLGISSPTAQADFALALQHRPVLLFDDHEAVPRPLSVDWLFSDHRVSLCRDQGVVKTSCDDVVDPRSLENGGTHLQLRLPASSQLQRIARQERSAAIQKPAATAPYAPPGEVGAPPPGALPLQSPNATAAPSAPGTAIYVHPVSVAINGRLLLYLDYWWYLPDNPSGIGGGAFCGAGLVIPGITCHNHESDWEGLTVVLDRTTDTPVVTAVQYAQHATVIRYPWNVLRRRWDTSPALARFVREVPDAAERPLAFVASGTHATYPLPCPPGCQQIASPNLDDGARDGGLPWVGNDTATCGSDSCLQVLPTREGGRQPALWNDFSGTWGVQHCALTYYCDSESPPTAPGRQTRYKHPTRCTGVVDASWRFHARPCDD